MTSAKVEIRALGTSLAPPNYPYLILTLCSGLTLPGRGAELTNLREVTCTTGAANNIDLSYLYNVFISVKYSLRVHAPLIIQKVISRMYDYAVSAAR